MSKYMAHGKLPKMAMNWLQKKEALVLHKTKNVQDTVLD
jgi:hypothetical protein